MIDAIRADIHVGTNSCSTIDECFDTADLLELLFPEEWPERHPETVQAALDQAYDYEGLRLEQRLNACADTELQPEALEALEEFEAATKPASATKPAAGMYAIFLPVNQAYQTMYGESVVGIGDANRSLFNDLEDLEDELMRVGLQLEPALGKRRKLYDIVSASGVGSEPDLTGCVVRGRNAAGEVEFESTLAEFEQANEGDEELLSRVRALWPWSPGSEVAKAVRAGGGASPALELTAVDLEREPLDAEGHYWDCASRVAGGACSCGRPQEGR